MLRYPNIRTNVLSGSSVEPNLSKPTAPIPKKRKEMQGLSQVICRLVPDSLHQFCIMRCTSRLHSAHAPCQSHHNHKSEFMRSVQSVRYAAISYSTTMLCRGEAKLADYAPWPRTPGSMSLWVTERYFTKRDNLHARYLADTDTSNFWRCIRLGVGVVNPYTRHPALLGMGAATFDRLSGGRICSNSDAATPVIAGLHGHGLPRPAVQTARN